MKIAQIVEGYLKEGLKSFLSQEEKKLAKSRMAICVKCPIFNNGKCDSSKTKVNKKGVLIKGCGCNMKKKVFCKSCTCPAEDW